LSSVLAEGSLEAMLPVDVSSLRIGYEVRIWRRLQEMRM
jgi:hypothetical protein